MSEFEEGQAINHRYRVVKRLGRGAMGTVYLTEDVLKVHRLVALKELRSESLDDPDFWSKGEYEALIRLRHPNLARVYDFGRIQGSENYYIVSEYIRGQDFFTATRGMDPEEVLDVIAQICRALEYIHTQGYVHFDIKPDNILITRERSVGEDDGSKVQWNPDRLPGSENPSGPAKVKLIDFGLAERITGSFDFAIKGTMNYVAPEILNGRTPDQRADLYSLGVTLYQIITGNVPFLADDGRQVARLGDWRDGIRRATADRPSYLQEILVRLLEDDPAARYHSAREIIQSLNAGSGRRYQIETAETQASYLYCSRLVGRQKELNRLKEEAEGIFSIPLVARASGNKLSETTFVSKLLRDGGPKRTPLFLLCGEIGIGKSRLFEEFTHFLRMREIPVHVGNCYETSHDAYQPFREIISQVALSLGLESPVCERYRGVVSRLCPRLRPANGAAEEETGFRPDKERLYFIDSLAHFLVDSLVAKPCVLTINNLHWADEASVELLAHLLEVIRQTEAELPCPLPVMMIASMRTDENSHPDVRTLVATLREEERVREITLRRFHRTQIAELIHNMLQIEEIPTPFLDRLEERTSGNPMFIVETLKGLQEEGLIARDGSDWRIRGDLSRIEIPHGIEGILLRRFRMLEPNQQSILEVLAVYDKPMSGKLLERFPDFQGTKVIDALRDLENRGLVIKELDGPRLQFAIGQPKLREIIYEQTTDERRRVLHGSVADVLAGQHQGAEDEIIEDLAYHYQRSDRVGKSLELTARAGDIMRRIFAHDRAVEHYRLVLKQTRGNPDHMQIWADTNEKVGDIGTMSGDYELAQKSYDALLATDPAQLPLEQRARILRKRGKIDEIRGEYDEALRSYKGARELLDASAESHQEERIRIFNAIGWVYVCMGKYERAMTISVEALRGIEGVVEKNEHAMLFATIGSANFYKGNLEQAIEFHSRALDIRENLENVPDIIISLNNLGEAHLANAEYAEALQLYQQALKSAETIGDAFGRAMALHHLAETYFYLGHDEYAERFLRESLKLSKNYKMRFLNNQNYLLQGRLQARQGELVKAEGNLFRALGVLAKQGNRWGLARCLLEVASVQLRRGAGDEAIKLVREALASAQALNIPALEARCRLSEVRALREAKAEGAVELLERLDVATRLLSSAPNVELLAEIEVERGDLLVAQRELDEARRAFAWAEEHFREIADRLPKEFRESYLAQHVVGFRGGDGFIGFREVPDMPAEAPAVPAGAAPEARAPAKPLEAGAADQEELLRVASLLQEVGQAGSSRTILEKVLHCVVQATGSEQGFLLGCQGNDVRVLAALHQRGEPLKKPSSFICLPALEDCLEGGGAILAPRVLDHSQIQGYEVLYQNNVSRLAILPLKSDGSVRGALYLNNPDARHLTSPSGSAVLQSYQTLLALLAPRSPINV
ncbi:MAG: serine/threonine-protein kinase PknK [Planctomycetota bacterium]